MPENRLGMIVCGAFLGLVSAVVVAKMRQPAAEPEKAVAAAAEAPSPKIEPAPTPAALEPEKTPAPPLSLPPSDLAPLPGPHVTAPPPPADAHPKKPIPESPPSGIALNDLPQPPGGFTPAGATETPPAPPPSPPGPPFELPAPAPPAPPSLPPPGPEDKKEKDADNKAKEHSKDEKDIKKRERANPDKEAAPPILPPPNGANDPPPPPSPPSLPAPPPEPKEFDLPKAPEKITPPPAAIVPPPPDPMPIKVDPPMPAPEPFTPKQDKVTVVIPPSPTPARIEPPPFVPSPAPRPIAPTPPSGAPLVDSWDERTYTAKPGDTYAAISQSEYKTEDYAKALQMYNQNHPRAGDAMRRDGTMAPGDRIYLPPSPVLEKRHADVIVRSKPKPVTAGSFGDDGSGPVQAEFRAPADKPANPTYKVQGNGETLFQIAANKLGDGNRWVEIAALNSKAPTDRNVLGGTILQMPAASTSAAPPVPHP